MAQYLYKTIIYTNDTNVIGLDTTQNASDVADYENNNQASTVKVSNVQVAETTFLTELDYTDFDALITGDYSWDDVKEADHETHYELYLITSSPI
jgi:hypothetical protein